MNYRDRIRDYLDEGFVEPHQIARRVMKEIPSDEYEDILNELMMSAVREVIRGRRNRQLGIDRTTPRVTPARHKPAEPVHVPGVGWVDRPNLTANYCDIVADHYEELAAKNQVKANEYRGLAKDIREAGVATLGEYLATNREKTRQGLQRARELGAILGRPSKITPETESLIRRMRDEEGKTYQQIVDYLMGEGIPTGHGAPVWRISSVRAIYQRVNA